MGKVWWGEFEKTLTLTVGRKGGVAKSLSATVVRSDGVEKHRTWLWLLLQGGIAWNKQPTLGCYGKTSQLLR